MRHKKNSQIKKYLPHILSAIMVIMIIILYSANNTINIFSERITQLEVDISGLSSEVSQQNDEIIKKGNEIESKDVEIGSLNLQVTNLNTQIFSLNSKLSQTQGELDETTRLLTVAQLYEIRSKQGIFLSEAYHLLGDYDKTVDIVAEITGVSTPTSDNELWLRGKEIYDWIGSNYQYCSDKGFCISETQCTQIQFFSPDELLYYGSQDVLCGDCDDKAQLFAGMMYASGVPHDKVRVECGMVSGGGHCWNGIRINNIWYRIDPTCSDVSVYVLEQFGLGSLLSESYPDNDIRIVDCFSEYETTMWYTADGVSE
jgi:hypothetical protein